MPKVLIVILSIVVIVTFLAITIPFIATIIFNQNVKKEVRELFNNNAGIDE